MYDPRTPPLVPFAPLRASFLAGNDSPSALLERCLDTLHAREPEVRAFVTLDLEGARRAAAASDARYRDGSPLSPVDGCPFGVKDIIETHDMPTQMGNVLHEGFQGVRDAACVHAVRQGGAVILGKTVTTEFACGNAGPTRNPFDLTRTPAGSSSGSGAAVGCGMLSAAFGTQTRASTIRPAAYNGAYGFKPTFGALNIGGVHPVSQTLDHLGTIGASLADCWIVARQVAAVVGADPRRRALAGPMELPEAAQPSRVAIIRTPGWAETSEEVRAGFDSVLALLRDAGVRIEDSETDAELQAFEAALESVDLCARKITAYELRWPMWSYRARGENTLTSIIGDYLALKDTVDEDEYFAMLAEAERLKRRFAALAKEADLVLTLSSGGPAPVGLDFTGSRAFITPWTVIGAPSLSLPLLAAQGLPIGVQLIGATSADAALLAHARWLDERWRQ